MVWRKTGRVKESQGPRLTPEDTLQRAQGREGFRV